MRRSGSGWIRCASTARLVKSDINGHPLEHDPKYLNQRIGMNSRLDTLQAAILIEKLGVFAEEIELRQDDRPALRRGPEGPRLTRRRR